MISKRRALGDGISSTSAIDNGDALHPFYVGVIGTGDVHPSGPGDGHDTTHLVRVDLVVGYKHGGLGPGLQMHLEPQPLPLDRHEAARSEAARPWSGPEAAIGCEAGACDGISDRCVASRPLRCPK
jgi:hypothetical protein